MGLKWKHVLSEEELFLVQVDSDYFAYFPLKHTSFKITDLAYNKLADTDGKLLRILNAQVANKNSITLHDYKKKESFLPHRVDLAITTKCNLDCVYCHANANFFQKDMDEQIAFLAVDWILENAKKLKVPYAQVGFNGGGEPTSNFELVKNVIAHARDKAEEVGIPVHFGMATNACYTEEVCEYVKDNFTHLAISLDGPKHIHNLHRPTIHGGDSFDTVFKNAKYL
ncbi:MAG: radical SAM protein, partial [Waddliaceae bacterium]